MADRVPLTRCILIEARGYDPDTKEWVYSVDCVAEDHYYIDHCPSEHEMFRRKQVSE